MKINKYWKLIFTLFFIFQITVITEEEKEFQEQLRILELKQVEEGGIACSSGSCAL